MSFNAGSITGSIGLKTAPLSGAIASAKGMLHGLETESKGIFSRIAGGLGSAFKFGAITAGIGVLGAAVGGLTFGAKLAANAEQSQVAFQTMLGSVEDAKLLLGDLRQFAATTPFEMPGLTDAARKLIAFGSDQKQVIPELRAIGDIAAGTGQNIGELAEIYGKARVSGRLMAEDVNQLVGRGIPVIQQFAKQFGVAESEVKGLVSEGKIGFGNLQQAFKDLTAEGSMFGGGMAAQSQTIDGLFSTLKDGIGEIASDYAAGLFEKLDVKGFISDLNEALPIVKAVQSGLLDLATGALGEVARMFGVSGDSAVSSGNKIIDAMEWGAKGIAFVADSLDAAVYGYDMLQLGVTKYYKFAAGGIGELLRLAAKLPNWLGGGLASDAADIADLFASNLDAEILRLQEKINKGLVEPSSGDRVMAFFEGIKQQAMAAGDAAAGIVPEIEVTAGITTGNTKAQDLLGDLRGQLEDIGLSDVEQKFADIRRKGLLNPDELKEARGLLDAIDAKKALEGIASPFEQYQKDLAQLKGWLSGGLIDEGQFDQLNSKARRDAFGEDKFASLNLTNSAEELSLRQKQAAAAAGAGPSQGQDNSKQRLKEMQEVNQNTKDLVRLMGQLLQQGDSTLSFMGI